LPRRSVARRCCHARLLPRAPVATPLAKRYALPMTEKLYYREPSLLVFDATVRAVRRLPPSMAPAPSGLHALGRLPPSMAPAPSGLHALGPDGEFWAVVLDRTCFYPGGGGQPADRGTLGGAQVAEVREEGDEILHLLASRIPEGAVRGELDAARRRDFMAQHTGQHILSRALMDNGGHETVSVHFGEESTDIEVASREVPEAELAAAEEAANRVVRENRRVVVHETDAAGAARFPLRKGPQPHR
jgi:hypothetical protein